MGIRLKKEVILNKVKWIKTRKRKTKILFACAIAMVIIATGIYGFGIRGKKRASSKAMPVLSAKAQKGNLSTTIEGTGTLNSSDSSDIQIPSGVTVQKVKVSAGDEVKKGDVLATIDEVSLKAKLLQTQKDLDTINGKISREAENDSTQYVTSSVEGRVKKIFAKKNKDVADTILEKGALILISLDGKMAVDLKTSVSVKAGQRVNVTLSDGTVINGTVVKAEEDSCTVTVTDQGTGYREGVSVETTSGKTVGSGKLYIHKESKVTAAAGTVKKILVSENETISEGDSLLKLKGDFQTADYVNLEVEKKNLEEELEILLKLSKNNTVTADSDGIITAVYVSDQNTATDSTSSGDTSSNGASTATNSVTKTSVTQSVPTITLLSAYSSGNDNDTATTETSRTTASTASTETGTATTDSSATSEDTTSKDSASTEATEDTSSKIQSISSLKNLGISTPKTGESPVTSLSGEGYTGSVQWNTKDKVFQADTAYQASVTLKAEDSFCFSPNITIEVQGAAISNKKVSGEERGNTLTFQVSFSRTEKTQEEDGLSGQGSGQKAVSGSGGSISSPGQSSTTSSNTSSDSDAEDTNTELLTAFSLASGDSMTLSVNVDELDILSVSVGQKVELTLDAVEEKQFEGKITSIDKNGTSNGGVTKYPVEITVSKDDSMLSGMNVSATIVTEEKTDTLLVPAQAVQEEGNTSYVYTEKNNKTGELSGKTTVETGATDGTNIEITSGLSEGDEVYYQMIKSSGTESDTQSLEDMSQMGGDMPQNKDFDRQGGGNGAPPSGGNTPGGGQK